MGDVVESPCSCFTAASARSAMVRSAEMKRAFALLFFSKWATASDEFLGEMRKATNPARIEPMKEHPNVTASWWGVNIHLK